MGDHTLNIQALGRVQKRSYSIGEFKIVGGKTVRDPMGGRIIGDNRISGVYQCLKKIDEIYPAAVPPMNKEN